MNLVPAPDIPSVVYLVVAYGFAVLVLGGYLVWSLRRLRQLEKRGRSER